MTHIVQELCGVEISKSQVSVLAGDLDKQLHHWRHRRLDKPYPYLVIDARYEKVRTSAGVVTQAVMIVVGVSDTAYREMLTIQMGDSENQVDGGHLLQDLKARGLVSVCYVISDEHGGLVSALNRHFQGILWQRCEVHFIGNFISKLWRKDSGKYLA